MSRDADEGRAVPADMAQCVCLLATGTKGGRSRACHHDMAAVMEFTSLLRLPGGDELASVGSHQQTCCVFDSVLFCHSELRIVSSIWP